MNTKHLVGLCLNVLMSITVFAATDDWAQHNRYATANQSLEDSV